MSINCNWCLKLLACNLYKTWIAHFVSLSCKPLAYITTLLHTYDKTQIAASAFRTDRINKYTSEKKKGEPKFALSLDQFVFWLCLANQNSSSVNRSSPGQIVSHRFCLKFDRSSCSFTIVPITHTQQTVNKNTVALVD